MFVGFILAEQWETPPRSWAGWRSVPRDRPSAGRSWWRGLGGAAGSVVVHALLFLFLILKLFGEAPDVLEKQPGASLTLIDVSSPTVEPQQDHEPPTSARTQAQPPVKVEQAILKPEWSQQTVFEPVIAMAGNAAAGKGNTAGQGMGTGGGGGGFDPYAGAAPIRGMIPPVSASPPVGSASLSPADINIRLGGRLVAIARSRWPTMRGKASFSLSTDAQGMIASVKWKDGTLLVFAREQLRMLLMDKDIGVVAAPNMKLVLGPLSI